MTWNPFNLSSNSVLYKISLDSLSPLFNILSTGRRAFCGGEFFKIEPYRLYYI